LNQQIYLIFFKASLYIHFYMVFLHLADRLIAGFDQRKVRAPQSRIAGNTRPSKDEDKCNRKNVQIML